MHYRTTRPTRGDNYLWVEHCISFTAFYVCVCVLHILVVCAEINRQSTHKVSPVSLRSTQVDPLGSSEDSQYFNQDYHKVWHGGWSHRLSRRGTWFVGGGGGGGGACLISCSVGVARRVLLFGCVRALWRISSARSVTDDALGVLSALEVSLGRLNLGGTVNILSLVLPLRRFAR